MADDVGFRPLFTRAPLAPQIRAVPSAYDAAPVYLVEEIAGNSKEIEKAIATVDPGADAREDSLKRQALIALELTAPIGFGIVRAYALGGQILHHMANPVVAVLAGPALFFTGKRLVQDLRRAFMVDPKVRSLMQRADWMSDRGHHDRAADFLRQALEQDLDPAYRRNADLYLKLGIAEMHRQRPRAALVAFARASVLYTESDALPYESEGRRGMISKRGLAEMLGLAAIDSFIRDDRKMTEWAEVAGDFAAAAEARFEQFAHEKERGHLLGMFGVDTVGAELCRELTAKVGFLACKMRLRATGTADDAEGEKLFREALAALRQSALDDEEHLAALMEQASFYAERTRSGDASSARRASELMREAAEVAARFDDTLACRIQAEAAAFVLDALPSLPPDPEAMAALRDSVRGHLTALEGAAPDPDQPFASLVPAWVEEKQYLLSKGADRRTHIEASYHAYMNASEPVSAMRSALRLAYLEEDQPGLNSAMRLLADAGRAVLNDPPEQVSVAFAASYLLDSAEVTQVDTAGLTRRGAAELFLEAAQFIRSDDRYVAFYLHGNPLVHPPEVAETVLKGLAAREYARAGDGLRAIAILEEVRARLSESVSPQIKAMLDLEHVAVLVELDEYDQARPLLIQLERDARIDELPEVQRRALELLHRVDHGERPEAPLDEGAQEKIDASDPKGLVGEYEEARRTVTDACAEVVRVIEDAGLSDRLRHGEHRLVDTLASRIDRLNDQTFRIAVVGEFSAGKSTLLNALLGDKLLPVSIRPTTATVTWLRWSEDRRLRVVFESGEEKEVEQRQLRRYLTEKGNPGNERGVKEVFVQGPVDLLRGGVEIVDTPGLSSLFAAHERVTYDIVPRCDAVILVATGRQPYGDSTGKFLDVLRQFVEEKVFYLLNKIDQLEEGGQERALGFAREWVGSRVRGARVYPVSAYQAVSARRLLGGHAEFDDFVDDPRLGEERDPAAMLTQSGIPALEADLGQFLQETRGMPLVRETAQAAAMLLAEAEFAIAAEIETTRMSSAQIRDTFKKLASELAERKASAEASVDTLNRKLGSELDRIAAEAVAPLPDLADSILAATNVTIDDLTDEDTVAALKYRLEANLRQQVGGVVEEAGRKFSNAVATYRVESRAVLRELQKELRQEFSSAFAIQEGDVPGVAAVDIDADLSGNIVLELAGDFAIGAFFGFMTVALGPIGFVLGALTGGAARWWIAETKVNSIKQRLSDELHTQLFSLSESLSEQFSHQVQDSLDSCTAQASLARDEVLAEFDAQLGGLVEERSRDERELADRRGRLKRLQEKAVSVRRALQVISGKRGE